MGPELAPIDPVQNHPRIQGGHQGFRTTTLGQNLQRNGHHQPWIQRHGLVEATMLPQRT